MSNIFQSKPRIAIQMALLTKNNVLHMLRHYWRIISLLIFFTLLGTAITLLLPLLISRSIDAAMRGEFLYSKMLTELSLVIIGTLIFGYCQSIIQVYLSEKVASDLRATLSDVVAGQQYSHYLRAMDPARLLTNFIVDVDTIKRFTGQSLALVISSMITGVSATFLLVMINWKLALSVIAILPVITTIFILMQIKVRSLYASGKLIFDRLNKIIDESIRGSQLIRILDAGKYESKKFVEESQAAKVNGFSIIRIYSRLIPLIPLTGNLATLVILLLGGSFVIQHGMTVGELSAFNSYIGLVIFPVLTICSMTGDLAEASASYERLFNIGVARPIKPSEFSAASAETIELDSIELSYGYKPVLENVSFTINAGSRIAIVGPTAAGKTQLLYILAGLIRPDSGRIKIDSQPLLQPEETLSKMVRIVFQRSVLFNMSIRENIAFGNSQSDAAVNKAIKTAELFEFIDSMPEGLDTIVSERGSSLSGGQKQRIVLARALAAGPKFLLLDDFIASVDGRTGAQILQNLYSNYPDLTIIFVSQKIQHIENYDKVIFLMQGRVVMEGTHRDLLRRSVDYFQLYQSQQSTVSYELQP